MISSSSSRVKSPRLILGFRWLNHRSWQLLPQRRRPAPLGTSSQFQPPSSPFSKIKLLSLSSSSPVQNPLLIMWWSFETQDGHIFSLICSEYLRWNEPFQSWILSTIAHNLKEGSLTLISTGTETLVFHCLYGEKLKIALPYCHWSYKAPIKIKDCFAPLPLVLQDSY